MTIVCVTMKEESAGCVWHALVMSALTVVPVHLQCRLVPQLWCLTLTLALALALVVLPMFNQLLLLMLLLLQSRTPLMLLLVQDLRERGGHQDRVGELHSPSPLSPPPLPPLRRHQVLSLIPHSLTALC